MTPFYTVIISDVTHHSVQVGRYTTQTIQSSSNKESLKNDFKNGSNSSSRTSSNTSSSRSINVSATAAKYEDEVNVLSFGDIGNFSLFAELGKHSKSEANVSEQQEWIEENWGQCGV
ncbi:unnamed protein product [Brugia pahangi]|uniref:Uncharacterized protein n=1 Tax=Brugia pahangi TaxID=6280 RepID=A0A0N4TU86_BRUPA|nr:unnamed protein product [Brugia pahangi]